MAPKAQTVVEVAPSDIAGQRFLLAEMAPPQDSEMDAAIKEYVKTRDKRMELTKKEKDLNQRLLIMLREKNLAEYTCDSLRCSIVKAEEKVSVKKVKEAE